LPSRLLMALASLLIVGLVIEQGSYFYQGLALPQNNLEKCNREVNQLIDSGAVLAGTYAPAMTIDNHLKGVIYFFGSVEVEKGLFEKYPITHVITDESNWKKAIKDYPVLEQAIAIRRFAVRDFTVTLYRMPEANVPLTDYEKAIVFFYNNQNDSALFYQEKFHNQFPDNLSSLTSLAIAYGANNKSEEFNGLLQRLVREYPDELQIQIFLRDIYNRIYASTNNIQYKMLAETFDRRAKELDPALVPRTH
jgi:tetratricopeptide (TPR) repeat protein